MPSKANLRVLVKLKGQEVVQTKNFAVDWELLRWVRRMTSGHGPTRSS